MSALSLYLELGSTGWAGDLVRDVQVSVEVEPCVQEVKLLLSGRAKAPAEWRWGCQKLSSRHSRTHHPTVPAISHGIHTMFGVKSDLMPSTWLHLQIGRPLQTQITLHKRQSRLHTYLMLQLHFLSGITWFMNMWFFQGAAAICLLQWHSSTSCA
jgi:hypothetical protein